MRDAPDRGAAARADDLAHRHVLELLAITGMPKQKRPTGQLSDVQHLAGKEQAIAKDGRQQVGVLARTH
jgi:hypothetical protein